MTKNLIKSKKVFLNLVNSDNREEWDARNREIILRNGPDSFWDKIYKFNKLVKPVVDGIAVAKADNSNLGDILRIYINIMDSLKTDTLLTANERNKVY